MIVGKQTPGAAPFTLVADTIRSSRFAFPFAGLVPKLAVYADGGGSAGSGTALARPVIHDPATGDLVARGDEIQIAHGQPAGWLDLKFSTLPYSALPAQDYYLGLHVGGTSLVARVWQDDPDSPGGVTANDTYADGTAPVLASPTTTTGRYTVYAPEFAAWVEPAELEFWYARLPWPESQAVFSKSSPVAATEQSGVCAWHGTGLNGERGAFAVAQKGGKFDPLVGERVRVRARGVGAPSVYVYVHDLADIAEDISLPRRAFQHLSVLGRDSILCTVTRLS